MQEWLSSTSRHRKYVVALWLVAAVVIPVWIAAGHVGWDVAVYDDAIRSLQAGHDPYVDAMAAQEEFRRTVAHPSVITAFSYVYSPLTLPLLRVAGSLPIWLSGSPYWLIYVAALLTIVWFGMQCVKAGERPVFSLFAPFVLIFPGLLNIDAILSGNVAFILYGAALAGAVYAWRTGRWMPFYAAVLAASCFKLPLLTLLALPLVSARRQWVAACATAVAGVGIFGVQSLIWPTLFHNFLRAVELQFSYNRDFGCSPAGIFSGVLFDHGIPYSPASLIFYGCYAVGVFALLLTLSRHFLAGRISQAEWAPVMIVGVILLNPRIMQYDSVPLTIPLALIAWRFARRFLGRKTAVAVCATIFIFTNGVVIGSSNLNVWKDFECVLLVALFPAGCWTLFQLTKERESAEMSSRKELSRA